MNILWQQGNYRIVEHECADYDLENLKGDCFKAAMNPDIDKTTLREREVNFEQKVNDDGVFGYVLEKWEPEVDGGWTHEDSCWGFVGYHVDEQHYIVDDFIDTANFNIGNIL